jgi:transcriptional regulator GlxA family with amidase domain
LRSWRRTSVERRRSPSLGTSSSSSSVPGDRGSSAPLHSSEEEFDALHAWIASHLCDDLSLPVLARKARMSERSFSRRYATAHGVTPSRAVARFRVEAACNLIAEGGTSMKRIAVRCGFPSEETMRLTFRRLVGATPREYRARFGG